MSRIWKPQPKEVLYSWIDALEDEASEELTEWEQNFLTSLRNQLGFKGELSQRQEEILEKIYAEKTK